MPACLSSGRVLRLGVAGCLFALTLPPPPAQTQEQRPGDAAALPVTGVVQDSLTHQPIARVLVTGGSDATLTDNEGRFELHLPAGKALIQLRRPGYEASGALGTGMIMPNPPHRVEVAAGMAPLTLNLTPAASIVMRVVLSSGDRPEGVRFTLYRRQVPNGFARWTNSGRGIADSQGNVRFPVLGAPASYVLCSEALPDRPLRRAQVYGYPGLCYPGGVELASAIAAPLRLRPGQQEQFEVDLDRQPFYPVTISVAGSVQDSAPVIQVYCSSGEPVGSSVHRASPGAPFVINLPNGSYYAEVREQAGPGSERYARASFTVAGGPVTGPMLVPSPVHPVTVQIRRDLTATFGPPVRSILSGALAQSGDQPGVFLSAVSLDVPTGMGSLLGGNLRRDPAAPGDDLYLWEITGQGRFRVHAEAPDSYVSSITSGGTDLAREPLVIGPGGSTQPIEIVLRNDMGKLACTYAPPSSSVAGGTPAEDGFNLPSCYAIPLSPTVEGIRRGPAPPPGSSSYHVDLPPGSYLAVAMRGAQQIDLEDAEAMARLTAAGQRVTIQPGQTSTVTFDRLADDDGQSSGTAAGAPGGNL